jgi:hypothetical protein
VRTFQLDENANHKQLADTCNAAGRCIVQRLPRHLVGKKDPVVLGDLLNKSATLVTMDFGIVRQHRNSIPSQNPGVIVVLAQPNTATRLMTMLDQFKAKCPSWPSIDWTGMYIEIDVSEVYVSDLTGDIDSGQSISYSELDFEKALIAVLDARRKRLIAP